MTGLIFLRKEKFDVIVDWQNRERTDSAEAGVEQTRGANEGRNASEDLDGRTGGVNRRTRAMRTKRNIVSYNEAHQSTIRRDPKKTRHTSLLLRKRKRLPVLPLEFLQLLVDGRLLGRTERGPLSLYV